MVQKKSLPSRHRTQSRRQACKVCRAPNERMRFQCGQGELAGHEGVGGFVFQQKEVSTYVREGNVNGELGTELGSARVWDTVELGEG